MPLTELECKNAKPRPKPYKLTDGLGMYLEVMPNGSRYWRLKYRHFGKEKRISLGVYPQTTLAEAREKRYEARKLMEKDVDPSLHRQETRRHAMEESQNTFEAVAKLWFAHKSKGLSTRYSTFMWGRLEKDILHTLGHRPINSIVPMDIIKALKRVEARGVHELARRLKQTCDEVFRYGVSHGLVKANPVRAFESRDVLVKYRKTHFAALEPKEIPEFLNAMNDPNVRMYPLTRSAMRLLMLTFVRTNELIGARWSEINLDDKIWIIPAERMKMRRPHLVPLSKQAAGILTELQPLTGHREFVFPGMSNPRKHMSNNTILQALAAMGYKGRMTGHGFRALAMSTIKERLGYRHEVIDLQLAHAKGDKIQAAYDRAQFIDERTAMMQAWADYLDKQASEASKKKVA